jgi:hypothetical protein
LRWIDHDPINIGIPCEKSKNSTKIVRAHMLSVYANSKLFN